MKIYKSILGIFSAGLLLAACNPQIEKKKDMPAPENATWHIYKTDSTGNNWYFQNTTPNTYITFWKFGNIATSHAVSDSVFFAYKGHYVITLQTASLGGVSTITDTIFVPTTDPNAADFSKDSTDLYHFNLAVTTPNPKSIWWVLPTGDTSSSPTTSFYWPWSGPANISLTVTASNGKTSTIIRSINPSVDDPANPYLHNKIFDLLTGGVNATNGKTWILNPGNYQANVGPATDTTTSYYHYPTGLTGDGWEKGSLQGTYTFKLKDYQYIPSSQNITASGLWAALFFHTNNKLYDNQNLTDPKHVQATYIPNNDKTNVGTGYGFTITNGSYMEYFEDRYKYYIVDITADTLYLAHTYNDDTTASKGGLDPSKDANARYFKYYAKK